MDNNFQPDLRDLYDNPMNWGSEQVVVFGANDQRRARLVSLELDVPQSVAVCCLPDPTGLIVRYWIRYGSGGSMRESAALPAGTYVCGGKNVYVEATYIQAPGQAVASASAWICYAAPTVP